MATKREQKNTRHRRIRSRISGTVERPRLAVFKSNRYLYAQLIDDVAGKTLVSADSRKADGKTFNEKVSATGKNIAELAKKNKIGTVVFDRGGFRYAGAIKSFADAARESGLTF